VHATIVRFAQTPYLRVALFLTVRRTYCTDLLLTVHSVLCEERPASTNNANFIRISTEQCLRRLVTRRSMRRPEFHNRSVHVIFVAYKMELRLFFYLVCRLFPVSILYPKLHVHLYQQVVHRNRLNLEKLKKIMLFRKMGFTE